MEITQEDFQRYLISLDLYYVIVRENENSFFAVITTEPNVKDFTQIISEPTALYPYWEVRLSKSDIDNEKITKGFFKYSIN